MKIQETTDRGEKLIEIGNETEARRGDISARLQGAQSRLAQARLALERASETDEEGNPTGDVGYAEAEVSAAMMDVEYYESQLEATESELERIRAEKLEIVRALDEYFEGEQRNIDILGQLQGKSFGGNVAEMIAAIVGRMNLAESTKAAILKSLGTGYSARSVSSRMNSSWKTIAGEHSRADDLKNTNPNYKPNSKWSINCQRCVPTYEMRRRGYNVNAKPSNGSDKLSRNPFSVWQSPQVLKCTSVESIRSQMKAWGDGARAQVVVAWAGYNSGHTFVAEQINGETVFHEPQIPSKGDSDVASYFDSADLNRTWICRIDTLEPSSEIFDCCKEN